MRKQSALQTERLILRPFTLSDAADVQRQAGDPAVATTTLNLPHPYEDGMAEGWISGHAEVFEQDQGVIFAVVHREDDALVGAISLLGLTRQHQRAELGYWIGRPYWGNGYATEAARAIIAYGFDELGLHRIYATFMAGNPASGRVMEKAGMTYEGTRRQHIKKSGKYHDSGMYGILRSDHATG